MTKTINPIMKSTYKGRRYNVFIEIKYQDGVLTMRGVEGPLSSGNCLGSCGQIDMHLRTEKPGEYTLNNGWTEKLYRQMLDYWQKWHLNDMHAECEHQEAEGKTWKTHPEDICPVCGYKLGSAWQRREVPPEVIKFLFSLPDSEKKPAWV